jgi:hypothetical protein
MPLDWTGIIVERDFYSEHYLKSVVTEVASLVYRFEVRSLDGGLSDEERTPILRHVCFGNHVGRRCCGSMTVMSG